MYHFAVLMALIPPYLRANMVETDTSVLRHFVFHGVHQSHGKQRKKKMKILSIETSCDETAIAIVEGSGDISSARFIIKGNALFSQIELHREYGGVFPALAKREHAKNIVPLTRRALEEANMAHPVGHIISEDIRENIKNILEREPDLTEQFLIFITEVGVPNIDAIAVTVGPGLSPALWVGVNFARALSLAWKKPIVAVNHMEGHIFSALAKRVSDTELEIEKITLPVLALLISGGHTELVLMRHWLSYELIGQTRDDAVGEAFDKVARMLGLPYPGGPEISKIAEEVRLDKNKEKLFELPRPMIADTTCDFSFSGLKTAVLYAIKNTVTRAPTGNPTKGFPVGALTEKEKRYLAYEFEQAVGDVLLSKTARAIEETNAHTLVLGGGVSANIHIGRIFAKELSQKYPKMSLHIPHPSL
ncbi:MAG TPA: tRNA (adenosine(37)-N6)-threonylcarbamoyltransferase complex transferase subunit TsaD, partial [Candidatus Kaiserbacteria bacterium]|nr:tRNA (adenosine(37)-N6)-threonylcarbamoyltransferase complex transferase subunit TsaD [Candidatus Kaiserbacteria bacterium]